MSTSRRLSNNGRSSLIGKQSQITTFFTPGKKSPSPNPSPQTPNPNPNSSSKGKRKKPPLAIPPTPKTPATAGDEAVGRRIMVFRPVSKAWLSGSIKSFEAESGEHLVQYDDAEEESLDLGRAKIEWVEEEPPRSLRRLRRMSAGSAGSELVVECSNGGDVAEESSGDDTTDDEDWDKVKGKDVEEDDSEEEEVVVSSRRGGWGSSSSAGTRKRKTKKVEVGKLDCAKKFRFDDEGEKGLSETPVNGESRRTTTVPVSKSESALAFDNVGNNLTGDAAERFGRREAEKFRFLGVGRKDACGRRPGDADYNLRTLYLPQEFLKSLSGGQRQWWEFKSKHMDKVLFFKMGKFYELFEMDAHVGARELDLQYMKGEQPHCGFPEKNFSLNLEKLARKGYRVLVVEQTETPEQLEHRRKEMGSKDKVVKREICAMVTKGTLTEGESLLTNPDTSYLMSITENCHTSENQNSGPTIGVCVVDVSTSKFMIGQFDDDPERNCLCSILSELRPVEIVKPSNVISLETERVLKNHTRTPLVNNLIPSIEFWDAEKTIGEIKNYYLLLKQSPRQNSSNDANGGMLFDSEKMGNDSGLLPDVLSELVSSGQNGYCALSALGGCLFYLRQAFLDEALLKCAKFESLPFMGFVSALQKPYMILDAAALENLEILENNRNGGLSGTLFAQLDHCVTSFGKRLLKGWLARPLHSVHSIVERQDAIAEFKGIVLASALEFRKELSRLPDMERLLARVFASCEANGRNANRVVLYEDAAKKQLREFISALRGCQLMFQVYSSLSSPLDSTRSSLLRHLLTPGKGLPNFSPVLEHFKDAFDWAEADRSGRVIPHEGADTEYDNACRSLRGIESNLARYLKEQHKLLGDASITYVTIGKESYLLEVPESLSTAVPRDYELRSSKKGYFRYWTPEIKKYLSELSQAESEKESKLKSILQRLIQQFSEHHKSWRQLVSTIAELDVLISLAIAGDYYEGPRCRPIIREIGHSIDDAPYLSAKGLGHPVLRSDALGKGSFVPNDVSIGGAGNASFILITGPNMGGKSTLLRQVCMAVILAQLGADVPAESFELSPVDRIFVRMGARDHIMAGQSTFLLELSETASVLSSATQNSLVVLDELGRGTSTSDGQAIAGSVLNYLVHTIQCRGLFSTHYHRLAVEYENDDKVSLYHMACQVGKGTGGVEEVTFLYRLTPGSCPKSYGVNVARLAGIPPPVLEKAMVKSREFESNYGNKSERQLSSSLRDDEVAVIQDLLHIAKDWNLHDDSQYIDLSLLTEIQQRARLLVLGN